MRYLVLSDLHANLEALEATLEAAHAVGFDRALVLGDLVGYGADPNAVVARVRQLDPVAIIRGNHDRVAAGVDDAESFNPVARDAALWTREALEPETLAYLHALTPGPVLVDDLVEICHGSPADEDAYVMDGLDALRALRDATRQVCLCGHTHVPLVVALDGDALIYEDGDERRAIPIVAGRRYLINAGSVGQPRDGDPRAAFAMADTGRREVTLFRVPYPVEKAQARIRAAGLPEGLALRLSAGR